nr:NAD-dependent epimerase/dehydratase family protein [Lachnospiraceae bacterium]
MKEISCDEKVDYIIHGAAITTSKVMVERPVETIFASIDGTKHVLEFAKEKKVKSVVYLSSMEMYGSFSSCDSPVKEDELGFIDIKNVRSNYPMTKRMCENMCVAYLSQYDVPVKIARLAQTFGPGILPGENRVFAQFARSAMKGEDIVLHTKGLSEGNYCYSGDAIYGILLILLSGVNGESYNVCNEKTHTTICDMAKMVCEKFSDGKSSLVFDIPKENTFGYAADTHLRLSSEKLRSLGWEPKVDLEEAYHRLILSMKEQ